MKPTFDRLTRMAARLGALLADTALFTGIVLTLGLGSSWYMVDAGSALTTEKSGPWTAWTAAARSDADPYTRAHFARLGVIYVPSELGLTYVAHADSDGGRLHSSCDYEVIGADPGEAWWSLSVFDDSGRLIPNAAGRHAFTSTTITAGPDGRFVVSLSRDARPGNWLPTGGAGRFALTFVVLDDAARAFQADSGPPERELPAIRKVRCR